MATLLFRLDGPIQSWGCNGRIAIRDAGTEPSKSGLIGLAAAALGRGRDEDMSDLAGLRMGIRVDREGVVFTDYSATGTVQSNQKNTDNLRRVEIWKEYIADALYLAGLEGEDVDLLSKIQAALLSPHYPLMLGRKCCSPAAPVYLKDGLTDLPLEKALLAYPPLTAWKDGKRRYVIEGREAQELRSDVPLGGRRFAPRWVRTFYV